MIVNGIVTAVLAVESVADIRTKSISLFRLIVYFVAGVVANLVFKYQSFISVVVLLSINYFFHIARN